MPQTAFAKAATDSIYKDSILQYSTAQLFLLVSEMFQLTTALLCAELNMVNIHHSKE